MIAQGAWTGVSLADALPLFRRDGTQTPRYSGAPNHTPQTVQMSCELAAAAYTMDPERWSQGGWRDFSMLINRSLMTGPALNTGSSPLNDLTRATLQALAKLKMSGLNPVGQMLGLRNQPPEGTASLKAIVMLKPQGGLMITAIGFMGTGRQLGDWLPNLRMNAADGLHEGFLQLAQEFDSFRDQIVFPAAAEALGLPSLTLGGIIEDMKQPHSRFRLWMSGHSQGSAVMQVFTDQLLREGVRPEYLCGYGFASPMVAYPGRPLPREGYPITHIQNADDLVPRVGAWLHFGESLMFSPTEADRLQMYGPAASEPAAREAQRLLAQARTAPEMLLQGVAILKVLREQSELTLRRVLSTGDLRILPDWLNTVGEGSVLRVLDTVSDSLREGYAAVSGTPLTDSAVAAETVLWDALLRRYGAVAWTQGLRAASILPHRLYRSGPGMTASYCYIVTEGAARLRQQPGFAPRLNSLASRPAAPRHPVRTVYPSWSSAHTFQRPLRVPEAPPAVAPKLTLPAEQDAPAVHKAPPGVQRLSRYASQFRWLTAVRHNRHGK